jgi:hypothetical protein
MGRSGSGKVTLENWRQPVGKGVSFQVSDVGFIQQAAQGGAVTNWLLL